MSTYRIPFYTTATLWVEVEADDFDEAVGKAYDEFPDTANEPPPVSFDDWDLSDAGYYVDGEIID